MEWTPDQQQVLAHTGGWLRVHGAAGTGKTTVLKARWRQRVLESRRPDRVLVLCRSRDAADAFGRVALGAELPSAEGSAFTTFHGFAFDVVRRHRGQRRLLTRAEQWTVIRRLLADDDLAWWPSCTDFVHRAAFVDEVAAAVLAVESAAVTDESVLAVAEAGGERARWADLLAFRDRYQRVTVAMGAVDSAQLFAEARDILAEHEVAIEESARWDEVLIDDADLVTGLMGRLIDRLAPTVLVAAGDNGGEAPRARPSRSWFEDSAWPGTVTLVPRFRPAVVPALVRCQHPSGEPEAIAGVLLEAHAHGVPWRDMAVLVRRQGPRVQRIGRALGRHGIPVRPTPGSSAGEPAVQALIDFFSWADGDGSAFDRLLVSPAVDLELGELRRLRRVAALGGPALAAHPRVAELVALRDRMAPHLASADPADLVHQAWVVLFGAMVPDPDADRLDVIGARALDAVAAFVGAVSERAAHNPRWRIADELALVAGPDFDPDPWVPGRRSADDEVVTVTTILAAGGRVWDTVVIAGCLEGELPRVSGVIRFFDRAVPERAAAVAHGSQWDPGEARAEAGLPALGERRKASLDEERRIFATATSRARRRLVVTAAPAPGQLVSRFVAGATAPVPAGDGPRVAVGALGLSPAAPTDGAVPVHLGRRLDLSATRLLTYDDCPRRYFYQYALGVRGPGGVAASMGTVVHAALADFLSPVPGANREPQPGSPVDRSWESLEGLAEALWRDTGSAETIAPYQPMREQARRDIFAMLQDWWQAEAARAEATGAWPDVVAVEYKFEIEVAGHRIRGAIDRIDRVPGGIAIVDYKTGSRVPRPDDVAEDLQLATYYLAAVRDRALVALGPPLALQLCYLRSGAWPSQPITADHEARTIQRIVDTAERILSEDFEPSVEAECDYCDFWRLCPLQIEGRQVGWE